MHSMKIKEVRTGSLSSRYSGGGVRAVKLALCAALLAAAAGAQPGYRISTVAGGGGKDGDGGEATGALLRSPYGVAVDDVGNLYIADTNSQRIRKVDTAGDDQHRRGHRSSRFSGDGGAATAAQLHLPWGVAVDGAGNLYFADAGNARIRKVDTTGTISTVAGTGAWGFSGTAARPPRPGWDPPTGVAVDGAGNLYIVDTDNQRIRKVNTRGRSAPSRVLVQEASAASAGTAARPLRPS